MLFSGNVNKVLRRITSSRSSILSFTLSELATAIYLGLFPALLLLGFLVPPDWRRFGYQWQAFGLTVVISSAAWLADPSVRPLFLNWLASSRVWIMTMIAWFYLVVIGLVHGVSAQFESLASGFLYFTLFPLAFYVFAFYFRDWHFRFLSRVLLFVLAIEDLFLAFYFFSAESPNSSLLDASVLPRIFINVRDGNFWAIAASLVAFLLAVEFAGDRDCKSALNRRARFIKASLAWFLVFFNGWITQGRGLFVSVFCALFVCLFLGGDFRRQLFLVPVGIGMCFSWLAFRCLFAFSCVSGGCFASIFDRFIADVSFQKYGRVDLWLSWVRSGVSESWLWGHGLGVKTVSLSEFREHTPHNLFVQILSDSGFWGVSFSLVLVLMVIAFLGGGKTRIGLLGAYCLVAVFVYLNVAAVLFWPAGIWLVSMVPLTFDNARESPGAYCLGRPGSLLLFCILSLACLGLLSALLAIKSFSY